MKKKKKSGRSNNGLIIGGAVVALLLLCGGGYLLMKKINGTAPEAIIAREEIAAEEQNIVWTPLTVPGGKFSCEMMENSTSRIVESGGIQCEIWSKEASQMVLTIGFADLSSIPKEKFDPETAPMMDVSRFVYLARGSKLENGEFKASVITEEMTTIQGHPAKLIEYRTSTHTVRGQSIYANHSILYQIAYYPTRNPPPNYSRIFGTMRVH